MRVTIRDAEIARDRSALMSFIAGSNAFETQFESDRRLDDAFPEEFLNERANLARTKQGRVLVAESETGSVLGWVMCYVEQHESFVRQEQRAYGYIAELYIAEQARGRHVGRQLLSACEDHFRHLAIGNVVITALSANTRAVNAYRAAGYRDYAVNFRKIL